MLNAFLEINFPQQLPYVCGRMEYTALMPQKLALLFVLACAISTVRKMIMMELLLSE